MSNRWRSGPPSSTPTQSFWQTPPNPHFENYRTETIPIDVDVVIIGSGLTGALIAYNLLSQSGPKPSICMLEARSAASGATGRNGGHIKPDCCRGFSEYREYHGAETAVRQCHFEAENLVAIVQFIKELDLAEEVDLVECETSDIYMSESAWLRAVISLNEFKHAGGRVEKVRIYKDEEAKKVTRVPACFGAITYPAASLWPYKLTIKILSLAIALGLNLQTRTPVTAIMQNTVTGRWKVITPHGEVRTKKVFHATNAYTSHLLPEFSGIIVPLKGHVAAIPPSIRYEQCPLERTMAFIWDIDYDYLIQRQAKGKHIIMGGRDLEHPAGLSSVLGDSDDSIWTEEIAQGLKNFPSENFEGWSAGNGNANFVQQTGKAMVWTGIMGFSKDCLPFLGELPGKPGQYIAAGFHGHGMARIFLSVKGLCEFVRGEKIDERIPDIYFDLKSRLVGEIDLVGMGIESV